MDRQFANDLDEASERVLKMTEKLLTLVELGQAEAKSKGKGKDAKVTKAAGKTRRKLEEEEDVVDGYKRGVLGVVDGLLEDAVSYILLVALEGLSADCVRTPASMTLVDSERRQQSPFPPTS